MPALLFTSIQIWQIVIIELYVIAIITTMAHLKMAILRLVYTKDHAIAQKITPIPCKRLPMMGMPSPPPALLLVFPSKALAARRTLSALSVPSTSLC